MIPFNIPPYVGVEEKYVHESIESRKICGDGPFTLKCSKWLEEYSKTNKALLTTSCTDAMEMAAILCQIEPGDEVIMPSFTFVSTATSFVLRGAKIVFVDVRPDTMNIDENLIETAITEKTKVIVPVHYAGVACNMDKILEIAKKHNLFVVEDTAQGIFSKYKGKSLGTIGDYGCLSFHETKNLSMGEGGALLIRDIDRIDRAEIIREKGTDRTKFFRGQIDKYSWKDIGSSYLPSELNAAYLWGQLENYSIIQNNRMAAWNCYYDSLKGLESEGLIDLPTIPSECEHNAHMFYIKSRDLEERTKLIDYLKTKGIHAVFHYIPLHSSPAGREYGRFNGEDVYTTKESERLLRLPLYYGIRIDEAEYISNTIKSFYRQ